MEASRKLHPVVRRGAKTPSAPFKAPLAAPPDVGGNLRSGRRGASWLCQTSMSTASSLIQAASQGPQEGHITLMDKCLCAPADGFHYVAQAGLTLDVLLPVPPECGDCSVHLHTGFHRSFPTSEKWSCWGGTMTESFPSMDKTLGSSSAKIKG